MLTYAFCNLIEALKFESSFVPSEKCRSEHQTLFIHISEGCNETYFKSTLWQITLCMMQFAKAVFSENNLCMLEISILVKVLHKIFYYNGVKWNWTAHKICYCTQIVSKHSVRKLELTIKKSGSLDWWMSMKDWSSNSHNMEMKTQQNEPLREAYDVNDEWVQDF